MKTNTQTDTPETDAVEQHVQRDINRKWVLSDFCKRKERERDAALRELAELRKDKARLDRLEKTFHIDATGDSPVYSCFIAFDPDNQCDSLRQSIDSANQPPMTNLTRIAVKCRELLNSPKAGGQAAEAGWRSTLAAIEFAAECEEDGYKSHSLTDAILAAWTDDLL